MSDVTLAELIARESACRKALVLLIHADHFRPTDATRAAIRWCRADLRSAREAIKDMKARP